jgi:toxin HigB-1
MPCPVSRKLKQLDRARRIEDLHAPPANRLEQLKCARVGQRGTRVNDRFRICFRWTGADAEDVVIADCRSRRST